jgi:hypothetical protein
MTNVPDKPQNQLAKVETEVRKQLDTIEPSTFSEPAFNQLTGIISDFIHDLIVESVNISRRHGADVVSQSHINIAYHYLISHSKRKIFDHLGTIGGIFLGAAISYFLTLSPDNKIGQSNLWFCFLIGIVGVFLIGLNIAKER